MRKHYLGIHAGLTIGLLAALTVTVFSQSKSIQNSPPLSEASPSSVGVSEERLMRIDAMLKQAIEQNQIPNQP